MLKGSSVLVDSGARLVRSAKPLAKLPAASVVRVFVEAGTVISSSAE